MTRRILAFIALASLAACGSDAQPTGSASATASAKAKTSASAQKKASASASGSASAAPAASASGSAGPGDESAERKGKMANCPNAAPNAKTELKDTPKGIEILVSATEAKDVEEIRRRAKEISDKAKGEATKAPHTGTGGGGGAQGRCPIVMNDTEITVADIDKGSKFTVVAKNDKEVDWVRREAKERLAAMSEPGAEEAGRGKMANCPSAVEGAKTAVKEDKGSIVLTITAKDEAKTKEIRDRAKKLAEIKHDNPKKGSHGGTGAGAEAGRCPAVLEGTTASVKEIDGGAEIALKPKNAADLKKLVTEATERAARFD